MDAKASTQTSRKGKKAWRKNISISDIDSALEAKRERQVLHGDTPDTDFVIDTEGSGASKAPVTKLKTTEILSNKSKVPALTPRKTKNKVSKARAQKLMDLAGRTNTQAKHKILTDRDGLVRGSNVDLWSETAADAQSQPVGPSTVSYTKATRVPGTLKHEPLRLHSKISRDELVHAGKSYNPSVEAWKSLVDREFVEENAVQMQLQALEQEQERIRHLMETLDDNEVDESDENEENEKVEAAAETADADDKYRLSINKPTEWKKKTRTQRNREARHKQRMELSDQLRELKVQLRDLSKLPEIQQEVADRAEELAQRPSVEKKYTRHSKHNPSFTPLEVKLSDELTNNLRQVRPEGNPFYEQMHTLQMSGKVEARVPVEARRRYKQKITEKYSYKQFK